MVKYIVQPGDTLGTIAGKYGTNVQAIVGANGIKNPNMIHVGQILRVPTQHYQDDHHDHNHQSKYQSSHNHHDDHYHNSGYHD